MSQSYNKIPISKGIWGHALPENNFRGEPGLRRGISQGTPALNVNETLLTIKLQYYAHEKIVNPSLSQNFHDIFLFFICKFS